MKKTLYIIHGWTYTVSHWEETIRLLEDYGIEVKMLRVPGLTSKSDKVWTIDDYAKWADQNIPDGAVALGHSNGGRILLNLLESKPNKLRRVILLDAAGVYEESKKREIVRRISKAMSIFKSIKPLRKVYHKLAGASDYDRAPENMKKTLTNMVDSDKDLDFSAITTPAIILWGKSDTVTPPRQALKMHKLLKNSTLKLFDDWTHAPYICDPEGLARAIYVALETEPSRSVNRPEKDGEENPSVR